MSILNLHPAVTEAMIAERQAEGLDRYDEVWDGEYVMAPIPNNEHQTLAGHLGAVLMATVEWAGLGRVFPGVNISDREVGWQHNYRCPDVVVLLNGTTARDCGTHWWGGPDLAVEIVSPRDHTRDKLGFYAAVGTRELLIIDRDPWRLELLRLQDGRLVHAGASTVENGAVISSEVVPLTFRLVAGPARPQIEVKSRGGQGWTV